MDRLRELNIAFGVVEISRPTAGVKKLVGQDVLTECIGPLIKHSEAERVLARALLSGRGEQSVGNVVVIRGARWYVVQTHPRAEQKAAAHLGRQGFEVYLPQYIKKRRHARRFDTVAAPLFPRYLFVAVDMAAQRWRSIQSTIGVARLVCNGEAPAPVAATVLAAIKEREDERGFIRLERRPRFRLGDPVRVLDGVFAAHLGLFEGMTDSERVTILLELLGRKVRVLLDAGYVAAA